MLHVLGTRHILGSLGHLRRVHVVVVSAIPPLVRPDVLASATPVEGLEYKTARCPMSQVFW